MAENDSSKRCIRIELSPDEELQRNVLERLSKNNIHTCKDLLSCHILELLKLTGLGYYKIRNVIDKCCEACAAQPITGYELLKMREERHSNFFPLSLLDLDEVLHGGLPMGTITEITGPSGCGKTQFCVMLSVLATLPTSMGGLEGAVIYLDTESAFSAERLVEVARTRFPQYYTDEQLLHLSSQVFVDTHQTCNSLIKRLETLEELIISKKVKLVILDSVASLVRKEYSSGMGRNMAERTNFLSKQAAILKYLAEVFSIPVVVTNQITTRFGISEPEQMDEGSFGGDGGYVTAALGNTWSHCVNTRLILQYLDGARRQVLVAKSPVAPFTTFIYTIQDCGIVQEAAGAGHYSGTDPSNQHIQVRSAIGRELITLNIYFGSLTAGQKSSDVSILTVSYLLGFKKLTDLFYVKTSPQKMNESFSRPVIWHLGQFLTEHRCKRGLISIPWS
ncbi:hypothetical protein ScPMuIL_014846 [Solemya velum]